MCGDSPRPGTENSPLPGLWGLRPAAHTSWDVSMRQLYANNGAVFAVWWVFPVWRKTSIIYFQPLSRRTRSTVCTAAYMLCVKSSEDTSCFKIDIQFFHPICWSWFCFRSIILTSYVSRRRANQKAIERLKDMLILVSHMSSNTYILTNQSQKEDMEISELLIVASESFLPALLVFFSSVCVCMICL